MLIFRHLTVLSASVAIALVWGAATTVRAMPPANPQSQPTAKDLLPPAADRLPVPEENSEEMLGGQPRVADLQQKSDRHAASPPQYLAQSNPTEVNQETQGTPIQPASPNLMKEAAYSDYLNPSGNPLLFPTKPEEVKIDIKQPITLQQAIALAIRNNKNLQVVRSQLEQSYATLEEAKAALYPTLQTQNGFQRNLPTAAAQQLGASGQGIDAFTSAFGNVTLNYNIYTGGEREATIRRSERQVRNSQLEVERIGEETRFQATRRYYDLQRADAQVAISQAAIEDFSQTLRDAGLLLAAGLGTRFDVLRAEADLASANQDLTRRIADQRKARRQLANVLSLGEHVELTAADEIQEAGIWKLSLEDSIVQSYKNRAELEQQLLAREIAEQNRYIALAGIKPQVAFQAQYNYNDNFDDAFPVGTGYNFQTQVTWQFFDGGRAFAGARRADRQMDQADSEFAQQRNQVRLEVEEAYYDLLANKDNIESTRQNVIAREEALRLARLRFQAGVGTQTDVINSQRDLVNARVSFLNAIVDYNQSLNALQRAVSNLPTDKLFDVETQP